MWHLWASKFGEYLIGTRHKDLLRERIAFRLYAVDHLEFTEAALTHREPFMRAARSPLRLRAAKATFDGNRIRFFVDRSTVVEQTSPAPLSTHGFVWGIEDLADHPVHDGFFALGTVEADRPDEYTARVPVTDDGALLSIPWGPVAFQRCGHQAVAESMQLTYAAREHPEVDPFAVARAVETNPHAPSGSFTDVARRGLGRQPVPYGLHRREVRR